jgi:hypothetical protein
MAGSEETVMDLPLLFHIGTQRAGSTYLFHLLNDHPNVSLYPGKEPSFYNQHFSRGGDWYRNCFPDEGTPIDTSPKYFMTGEQTAPRIRRLLAGQSPRFLLILRNPIDYVYSHFRFHTKHGHFHRSPQYPRTFPRLLGHVEAYPGYLERGMYWGILHTHWLTRFDADQFKIVIFEEFIRHTDQVLDEILTFFDLPPAKLSAKPRDRNRLFRHRFLYALRGRLRQLGDRNVIKRTLKALWQSKLYDELYVRFLSERPRSLTSKERATLASHFAADVAALKRFLESDIPAWKDFPS